MTIQVEIKNVVCAKFWHNGSLIAGILYKRAENNMICQYIGKDSVNTFWHACWNDGKDIHIAVERMERELRNEYGDIEFVTAQA